MIKFTNFSSLSRWLRSKNSEVENPYEDIFEPPGFDFELPRLDLEPPRFNPFSDGNPFEPPYFKPQRFTHSLPETFLISDQICCSSLNYNVLMNEINQLELIMSKYGVSVILHNNDDSMRIGEVNLNNCIDCRLSIYLSFENRKFKKYM